MLGTVLYTYQGTEQRLYSMSRRNAINASSSLYDGIACIDTQGINIGPGPLRHVDVQFFQSVLSVSSPAAFLSNCRISGGDIHDMTASLQASDSANFRTPVGIGT